MIKPPPKRHRLLGLSALFALGLGLRLWGAGFGLPYPYHPDEPAQYGLARRPNARHRGAPATPPSTIRSAPASAFRALLAFAKPYRAISPPPGCPLRSRLPTPEARFPTPDSRSPTHDSRILACSQSAM